MTPARGDARSLKAAYQFAFAPEALTTFAHFSVSFTMNLPNSADDRGSGTPPSSMMRLRMAGSACAASTARFSFSTASVGVPFGAPRPANALV